MRAGFFLLVNSCPTCRQGIWGILFVGAGHIPGPGAPAEHPHPAAQRTVVVSSVQHLVGILAHRWTRVGNALRRRRVDYTNASHYTKANREETRWRRCAGSSEAL